MRGLSLKDPFAGLIAKGFKTIETRTWATSYRGDILICSSQKPYSEIAYVGFCVDPDFYQLFIWKVSQIKQLPGHAVAVARIRNCRDMTKMDEPLAYCQYDEEDYKEKAIKAWELTDIRPIKPFRIKGELSLFKLSEEALSKIIYL